MCVTGNLYNPPLQIIPSFPFNGPYSTACPNYGLDFTTDVDVIIFRYIHITYGKQVIVKFDCILFRKPPEKQAGGRAQIRVEVEVNNNK